MKVIRIIGQSIITALVAALLLVAPVYALLAQPSSPPTFVRVRIFQDLVETGDFAAAFEYYIPYTSYPATPASSSIIFRLLDTDGVTQLSSSVPYAYYGFSTNGYGKGASLMYFDSTSAPAWGGSYYLNIFGSPLYFSPIIDIDYPISTGEYSDAADQDAARADFYNFISAISNDLSADYSIDLMVTSDSGMVLSTYGDSYFRNAIPGISAMCSQLFIYQTYIPSKIPTVATNMTQADTYKGRMQISDMNRSAKRIGAIIGVGGEFVFGVITFGLCMTGLVVSMKKQWGIEIGIGIAVIIGTGSAIVVGDAMFTILMVIVLVVAILIFFILWQKRS